MDFLRKWGSPNSLTRQKALPSSSVSLRSLTTLQWQLIHVSGFIVTKRGIMAAFSQYNCKYFKYY